MIVANGSSASGGEAFRWTKETGSIGLGDAPGGGFKSNGRGSVSADGTRIAGQTSTADGDEAYLWTQETGIVPIGDLPGGNVDSSAYDISADGATMVGRGSIDGAQSAFVWDETHGMRNLQELLFSDKRLDLTCWALHQAYGVSGDGTIIVGDGINPDGQAEAWRADLSDLQPGSRLPGDTNGDDRVDVVDLNNVRNNFADRGLGDVDLNCGVGVSDLNLVRNNFGAVTEPVPEPSTLALLAMTIAGVVANRRRRR